MVTQFGYQSADMDGETMTDTDEAIVRELAERGHEPVAPYPDEQCWRCLFCREETAWIYEAVPESFIHEPTCLWRRARELHPEVVPLD